MTFLLHFYLFKQNFRFITPLNNEKITFTKQN